MQRPKNMMMGGTPNQTTYSQNSQYSQYGGNPQQFGGGGLAPISSNPQQNQLNSGGSQQNLLKLKYRVIYCSGEDPEYPVTELLDPTPNSRGWQSQKFCEYPQEIIVQFPNVVRLKQLQFLSHQAKIASRIELFTYLPSGTQALSSQIPLSEIQYKRLGYLSLDPNERSGFQARELKSVYVDSQAVILKLIFHKCHLNNFNVFNQIGLVALNCIGLNNTPTIENNTQDINEMGMPGSSQSRRNQSEFDNIDPEIVGKIKLLEQAKDKAVKNENFDEAKKIKEGIERLRSVGIHINQLDERKRMATMNEDYDAAKIIKMEIEKLKEASYNPWLEGIIQSMQQPYQQMRYTQNQFGSGQQQPPGFNSSQQNFQGFNKPTPPMAASLEDDMNQKMNIGGMGIPSRQRMQSPKIDDATSPPSIQNQLPINNKQGGLSLQNRKTSDTDFQREVQKGPVDVDEQIIPTMNNNKGKNSMPQEYEDGYEDSKEAEELSGDKIIQAQPLIAVFGPEDVKKIYSRTWQLREEGINNIENLILNDGGLNEGKAFVNGVGVVRYTVGDKMAQVAQRSMQFLTNLCRNLKPILNPTLKGELQSYTEPIISQLVDKLGDNLMKVRTAAEDSLLAMAEHPGFGNQAIISVLTRAQPATQAKDAKKNLNSTKHIIGKYSILLKMLQAIDFQHDQLKTSVNFALKGVQHQLQDVRNVAYRCMTELYRQMGPEIKQYLTDLRPAQLEQLEAAFSEVDGGSGISQKLNQNNGPKETITTNIDPMGKGGPGGKAAKKGGAQAKKPQHDDEYQDDQGYGGGPISGQAKNQKQAQKQPQRNQQQPEEQTCGFCGRFDQDFNDESLDIHYWKECPMLAQCWECGQVIEISTLNEHLLEECERSEDYKLCSKCKGVYRVDEFNQHECIRPRPNGAVKCQLCKENVFPIDEDGWRKHIMQDKCIGNPRLAQ